MQRIRRRLYLNLTDFTEVAPGRYTVRRQGELYRIEGGKRLGGTRRDWYLEGPGFSSTVNVASIRDALRLLDEL